MIKAAITPGTQPARVSRNTIITEPQPRSTTASGGKKMARITRRSDNVLALKTSDKDSFLSQRIAKPGGQCFNPNFTGRWIDSEPVILNLK